MSTDTGSNLLWMVSQ